MGDDRISIRLFGGFAIVAPDGTDLTPRAMKTQALAALMATARDHKRSRAWLQDHLWSDRDPRQASGSLRQALHDLKSALGDAADVLEASRATLGFAAGAIAVPDPEDGPAAEQEFLAGIDVKDQEFNEWLRSMRAHFEAKAAPVPPPVPVSPTLTPALVERSGAPLQVRILAAGTGGPDMLILETILIETIQRTLREAFNVELLFGLPEDAMVTGGKESGLIFRIQCLENVAGNRFLRASLETLTGLRSFWSETAPIAPNEMAGPENFGCQSLAHRATAAFADLVLNNSALAQALAVSEADLKAALALRKMFTMRADEVAISGDLLHEALSEQQRGLYHAWLAQVLCIQHVEQQVPNSEALRDETEAHVRYALELEPMNSNVLAASANARLIFDNDTIQSGALARQAVALNRGNPLTWFAWANANLYGGSVETAYAAAVTAQALGANSSIEFWTAFQRALSAAVTGRLHEAMSFASVSNALAPNFRPPLRYLTGIASKLGRMPDASRAITRLTAIEQEFSVERMVNDPSYPVSMMRRAKLIVPEKLTELY